MPCRPRLSVRVAYYYLFELEIARRRAESYAASLCCEIHHQNRLSHIPQWPTYRSLWVQGSDLFSRPRCRVPNFLISFLLLITCWARAAHPVAVTYKSHHQHHSCSWCTCTSQCKARSFRSTRSTSFGSWRPCICSLWSAGSLKGPLCLRKLGCSSLGFLGWLVFFPQRVRSYCGNCHHLRLVCSRTRDHRLPCFGGRRSIASNTCCSCICTQDTTVPSDPRLTAWQSTVANSWSHPELSASFPRFSSHFRYLQVLSHAWTFVCSEVACCHFQWVLWSSSFGLSLPSGRCSSSSLH